jgi:hypothetical protein
VNKESSLKKRNVNLKAHERKKSYRHGRRSIVVGEESDNKFRPAQNPQSGRQKPQNANGIGTDLSNKYYRPFQKMNPSDIDHLLDERRSQKTKLVQ